MDNKELQVLFGRLRNGDKTSFSELYSDLKTPVYTVVCRIVKARETAEDVTQELFIKLYTAPPDDSVCNIRAWIFRMARNLAIDALRKKQASDLTEDIPDSVSEDKICTRLDLDRAVRALPLELRETVALHLNAGLSFREIAEVTNRSLPSVYRLYRKALKQLRESLNGGSR